MTPQSSFAPLRDELHSSNFMQLELIRGITERGVPIRMPARGFSMSPFIHDGDVLVIAPLKGRQPRLGDVVAFTLPNTDRLAIHRIVARHKDGWLVRGDNSSQADGIVGDDAILGVVIRVERDGCNIRLGLGVERVGIALLNRSNLLPTIRELRYLLRRLLAFPKRH